MTTPTQATSRSEAVYCTAGQTVMHVLLKHQIKRAGTSWVLIDPEIPLEHTPYVALEKQRKKNEFQRKMMPETAGFWALSLFLREQDKQLCKTETVLDTFVRAAQSKGKYHLSNPRLVASYKQMIEFESMALGNCLVSVGEREAFLVRQSQVTLKDPAVQKTVRAVTELILKQDGAMGGEIVGLCAAQPGFQQVQKQLSRFQMTVKMHDSANFYQLQTHRNFQRCQESYQAID